MFFLQSLRCGYEYHFARIRFFALDDTHFSFSGTVKAISIPNACRIKYVNFFESLFSCQQSITEDSSKRTWLLLSDKNMRDWNRASYPNNIDLSLTLLFYRSVADSTDVNPETRDLIIDAVCEADQVDNLLLRYGLSYINAIKADFRDDHAIYNRFCDDANGIVDALGLGVDARIARLDAELGVETSDMF